MRKLFHSRLFLCFCIGLLCGFLLSQSIWFPIMGEILANSHKNSQTYSTNTITTAPKEGK